MLRLPAAEGPDRVNDAMVKRVAPYLEQGGIIVMISHHDIDMPAVDVQRLDLSL